MPVITEFTRRGRIVLNARFAGATDGSYRALRADWVGRPTTDPAVAAQRGPRRGVGELERRHRGRALGGVLGGAGPDSLAVVGGGARNGFETALSVAGQHAYVAVRALDASSSVLGTSRAVQP